MMLEKCNVARPFTPAQHIKNRHSKRCCCIAPSTSAGTRLSRPQTCRSSHSDSTVDNSNTQDVQASATRQQHAAGVEGCLQPFVTTESRWWDWKYSSRIHYRQQGTSGPCILLVHGFGVGSFHFEQLIQKLSSAYQVWAVDLLGQGLSWPTTAPAPGHLPCIVLHSPACLDMFIAHMALLAFRQNLKGPFGRGLALSADVPTILHTSHIVFAQLVDTISATHHSCRVQTSPCHADTQRRIADMEKLQQIYAVQTCVSCPAGTCTSALK